MSHPHPGRDSGKPSDAPLDHTGAPGTTLYHTGAPGTTLDHTGAPGTTLDLTQAAATSLDAPASAVTRPATPRRHRINLPAALEEDYRLEREIGHGAEADLLLAVRLKDSNPVVVRRYRDVASYRSDILDQLQRASPQHVIRLLDHGRDHEAAWEIIEYARYGSLADLARTDPFPWRPERVAATVRQLTDGLADAHAMGMVHRDVKPANVLVRQVEPQLDVVLTDFGLARVLAQTEVQGSLSRTPAYAAPEAAGGTLSRAMDWWSLGVMTLEMITGQHPFRVNGEWLPDLAILSALVRRDLPLDRVDDPRWQLLLRGLLTREPQQRWNETQIRRWFAGQAPPVARGVISDDDAPGVPSERAPRRPARPFSFRGGAVASAAELAGQLRANWRDAVRLLSGQQSLAPQFLALRDWLSACGEETAARIIERTGPTERILVQLLLELEPEAVPTFRGWVVNRPGLVTLMTEAPRRADAVDTLTALYDQGILDVLDGAPGCAGFDAVGERWRLWFDRFAQCVPPAAQLPQDRFLLARSHLLAAALSDATHAATAEQAQAARQDRDAMACPWFRQVAAPRQGDDGIVFNQLTVLLRDLAVAATEKDRADALAEQRRQEEFRRARQRDSVDRFSAVLCFGLSLFSAIPLLGLGAAAGAVYFGVRAHRSGRGGCLVVLGMLFAVSGAVASFGALATMGGG